MREDEPEDVAFHRADREAHADFPRALLYMIKERAIQTDGDEATRKFTILATAR